MTVLSGGEAMRGLFLVMLSLACLIIRLPSSSGQTEVFRPKLLESQIIGPKIFEPKTFGMQHISQAGENAKPSLIKNQPKNFPKAYTKGTTNYSENKNANMSQGQNRRLMTPRQRNMFLRRRQLRLRRPFLRRRQIISPRGFFQPKSGSPSLTDDYRLNAPPGYHQSSPYQDGPVRYGEPPDETTQLTDMNKDLDECVCGVATRETPQQKKQKSRESRKKHEKATLKQEEVQTLNRKKEEEAMEKKKLRILSRAGLIKKEENQDRIVNGYAVNSRPWLVTIVTSSIEHANFITCAGALINHWFFM